MSKKESKKNINQLSEEEHDINSLQDKEKPIPSKPKETWAELKKNIFEDIKNYRRLLPKLDDLIKFFNLTYLETDILLICVIGELDYYYQDLWGRLQNNSSKIYPSIDIVLDLLASSFEEKIRLKLHFDNDSKLFKYCLIQCLEKDALLHGITFHDTIKVSPHVLNYILGHNPIMPLLSSVAKLIVPTKEIEELNISKNLKTNIISFIEQYKFDSVTSSSRTIVNIIGNINAGQNILAEAMCKMLKKNLLIINIDDFLSYNLKEWDLIFSYINREAIIQDAVIYWDKIESLSKDDRILYLNLFLDQINKFPGLHFFSQNFYEYFPFQLIQGTIAEFKIPTLTTEERLNQWHNLFQELIKEDLKDIAYSFQFELGQIFELSSYIRSIYRNSEIVSKAEIYSICRNQAHQYLSNFTSIVKPLYKLDDIILSPNCKEELKEIISWVEHKEAVYEKGGFNSKVSLGKGLIVLFAGPSGTGKTMAAEVIANSLNLFLYKINLSTILSKFVGETEKHLDKVFNEAKNSNVILFFDEADSLFGKRGEVKDARDNYANIQTSYLLQKVEEYSGMVILSTNYKNNIDEAFARRLHFSINFQMPEASERLKIWENIWPENIRPGVTINLETLSEKLEVSGGNIRNIALAASFKSIAECKVSINQQSDVPQKIEINCEQLLYAIKKELRKIGRIIVHDQLNKIFNKW